MKLPDKWVDRVWVRNPDDHEQVAEIEVGDVVEFLTPYGWRIEARIAAFWTVALDPEEGWFMNADPRLTFAAIHNAEDGDEHDLPITALLTHGQRKRCRPSVFKRAL